ncbi:MAG: PadR family transcriptional regulator [Gammaproteobacteria bacterium]|nr:PadR family transcriptional regulator [Gammaproteobacteria bacterium]
MDVKTVCLGMLTFGEATGYDLKKHFEGTFEHFFATGFGSIYPALASLAEDGLVTCTEVAQDGKPARKVYRITSEGERILHSTLEGTRPAHKMRSEFLAMLYFAHLLSPQKLAAVLDQKLGEFDRALALLEDPRCPEHHHWPASVRFVSGFGSAMLTAAREYILANRHLLENTEDTEQRTATTASAVAHGLSSRR